MICSLATTTPAQNEVVTGSLGPANVAVAFKDLLSTMGQPQIVRPGAGSPADPTNKQAPTVASSFEKALGQSENETEPPKTTSTKIADELRSIQALRSSSLQDMGATGGRETRMPVLRGVLSERAKEPPQNGRTSVSQPVASRLQPGMRGAGRQRPIASKSKHPLPTATAYGSAAVMPQPCAIQPAPAVEARPQSAPFTPEAVASSVAPKTTEPGPIGDALASRQQSAALSASSWPASSPASAAEIRGDTRAHPVAPAPTAVKVVRETTASGIPMAASNFVASDRAWPTAVVASDRVVARLEPPFATSSITAKTPQQPGPLRDALAGTAGLADSSGVASPRQAAALCASSPSEPNSATAAETPIDSRTHAVAPAPVSASAVRDTTVSGVAIPASNFVTDSRTLATAAVASRPAIATPQPATAAPSIASKVMQQSGRFKSEFADSNGIAPPFQRVPFSAGFLSDADLVPAEETRTDIRAQLVAPAIAAPEPRSVATPVIGEWPNGDDEEHKTTDGREEILPPPWDANPQSAAAIARDAPALGSDESIKISSQPAPPTISIVAARPGPAAPRHAAKGADPVRLETLPNGTTSTTDDPKSGAAAQPEFPMVADWEGLLVNFPAADSPGAEAASQQGESGYRGSAPPAAAAKKRLVQDSPASQPASTNDANQFQPSNSPVAISSAPQSAGHPIPENVALNSQQGSVGEATASFVQVPVGEDSGGNNGGARPASSAPHEQEWAMAQPAASIVPSARVLERMGQAELRVGMNTAAFGNVEVRTTVADNHVAASVLTAHSELRSAMVAEMPSLQQAMEQRQLRLERFDFSAQTGSNGHGSASEHPKPQPSMRAEPDLSAMRGPVLAEEISLPAAWTRSSGINVHA